MRIVKTLIVLLVVALIAVGGVAAAHQFYDFDLKIAPRNMVGQIQVPPAPNQPDPWVEININRDQFAGDITEPGKSVRIYHQVIGKIAGQVVRLEPNSLVTGPITAGTATVLEATVRNNIQADSIFVGSRNEYDGDRRYYDMNKIDTAKGKVFGDLIGQDIRLGKSAEIFGQVGGLESRLDVAGQVNGQVTGKKIILRSTAVINGDMVATAGTVTMEPGATLNGRLTDPSGKGVQVVRAWVSPSQDRENQFEGARMTDPKVRMYQEAPYNQPHSSTVVDRLAPAILWIPILVGLSSLVVLTYIFLAGETESAVANIRRQPWRCLWLGFLTLLVTIPLGFLLAVTVLGIPLAFALVVGVAAAKVVGFCAGSLIVGQKIAPYLGGKANAPLVSILIGAVLIFHLVWVPVLGWGILAIITLMGLGAVMMNWYPRLKDGWRQWRTKRKQQPEPA